MTAERVKIKYPRGEDVMTAYRVDGETVFLMTRKENTVDGFSLYKVSKDGALERVGKGKDPIELEEKCGVFARKKTKKIAKKSD